MTIEEPSEFFTRGSGEHIPKASAPIGVLQAVNLPGYPEAHLQPVRRGHFPAFVNFIQAERDFLREHLEWVDKLSDRMASYIEEEKNGNRISFFIFDGLYGSGGSLVGFTGLNRNEEYKRNHTARVGTYVAQNARGLFAYRAAQVLLACGQEQWQLTSAEAVLTNNDGRGEGLARKFGAVDDGARFLPLFGAVAPAMRLDLPATEDARMRTLEGSQHIYKSPFGRLISELHGEAEFWTRLGRDIQQSEEKITLGGLFIARAARLQLLPELSRAKERNVHLELNTPPLEDMEASAREEGRLAIAELGAIGVDIQFAPDYGKPVIVDGKKIWRPGFGTPGIRKHLQMQRIEAEQQIPESVLQSPRPII